VNEEQAKTATLDKLRNWLAVDDGWHEAFRHRHASGVEQWCWERDGCDESFDHPHPPTLDGAAAALPKRWELHLVHPDKRGWHAAAKAGPWFDWRYISTDKEPDELTSRYRLAVLCRLAEKAVEK